MPRFTPIQSSFNAGEWSSLMHGRTDLATYARACKGANNYQIVPQGGLIRRSGFRYVADTKFANKTARLEEFIFSDIQAYTIEFGDFYARFFSNEGVVVQQTMSGILPVDQIATLTDEFTIIGHGYNLDEGPVQITSTGTIPTGLFVSVDYYIKPASTITFQPADIQDVVDEDITVIGHDLQTQMGPYQWSAGTTLPGGMDFDTDYYIIRVTDDKFQVSLTKGGGAQPFSSQGSGTLQLIPTDEYIRNQFRLTHGPGQDARDISVVGTGIHTLTPVSPDPIEVATPYSESEVEDLQFAQSADVLYITHKNHIPRTLSRFSAAGFFLSEFENADGPYLDENTTTFQMAAAATTGKGIVITAKVGGSDAAFFVGSDVGRTLRIFGGANWGYGKIVSLAAISFGDADVAQATMHATPGTAINAATEVITTAAAHGFDTGELVRFKLQTSGVLTGTGISVATDYYVNVITTTTFSLHLSRADAIADTSRVDLTVASYAPTVSVTSSVIDIPGHGHIGAEGPVLLTNEGGALPEGLATGTNYFIGFVDANALTLSLSRGGDPKGIDDRVGGGIHTISGDGVPVTQCKVNIIHAFENTADRLTWRLSAWGSAETLGFPRAVTFFEQRLWFAATKGQPDTVFSTRSGNFTNFAPTGTAGALLIDSVVSEDNGITYELGSNEVNVITWMSPTNTLVLGTSSSSWTLSSTLAGVATSPLDIQVRRSSAQGSAEITPVIVGERVVAVSKTRLKLFSLGFSLETDSFTTEDLTLFAEHITRSGLNRVAYAPEPYSTIWASKVDGGITSLTLIRDQRIAGWTRHTLGGAYVDAFDINFDSGGGQVDLDENTIRTQLTPHGLSTGDRIRFNRTAPATLPAPFIEGRDYYVFVVDLEVLAFHLTETDALLNKNRIDITAKGASEVGTPNNIGRAVSALAESVAVIPAPVGDASSVGRDNRDHDQVWAIVKRTVGSVTVRSVEFMEDFFADDDVTEDAFFVDGGVTYNSSALAVIPGFTSLSGETVDVLADGRPLLDQTISATGVLTLETAASKVHVGHRYPSVIETLRQNSEDREGTAQGKLGRITHLTMRLHASLGGEYGASANDLFSLGRLLLPASLQTDVVASPYTGDIDLPFEGGWDTESTIYITQEQPLPFTLVALLPSIVKGSRSDRARGGTA